MKASLYLVAGIFASFSAAADPPSSYNPVTGLPNLCLRYSKWNNTVYFFNNNRWGQDFGTGSACTIVDSVSPAGVSFHTNWTWAGNTTVTKGFPNSSRLMPVKSKIKDIKKIDTSFEWSYTNTETISANVVHDFFITYDDHHNAYTGDNELMIWYGRWGESKPTGELQGKVTLADHEWEIYYGKKKQYTYTFVATKTVEKFDGDVKPFFDYLIKNKSWNITDMYLNSFQLGSETLAGTALFTVKHWKADLEL